MSDQQKAIMELYNRGALSAQQKAAVDELIKRGAIASRPQPTPDELIRKEQQDLAYKDLAKKQSMMDTFLIGVGKGMYDVGRGLGVVKEADDIEKRAFQALSNERPFTAGAGEITGQAAPFLIPGGAAGGISSTAGRIGASAAIGALEGGVISRGTGGDEGEIASSAGIGGTIAGGLEAVSPMLGRVIRKAWSKLSGGQLADGVVKLVDDQGNPSQELLNALKEEGVSWTELPLEFKDMIAKAAVGSDPQQAAKLARFESAGMQPTLGQLTGDFDQLKREQQLLVSGAEQAGDEFRAFQLSQSEAMSSYLDEIIKNQNMSSNIGADIKESLLGRRSALKSERREAYKKLAEQADEIGQSAISPSGIISAMPDARTMRSVSRAVPDKFSALNDWLAEFGLRNMDAEQLAAKGIEPEPLSLSNFEEFRKGLNRISQSDQTGTIDVLIGPLKNALDDEVDMVAELFSGSSGNIAATAKEARRANIALKDEFDPAKITSKLIDSVKRGSNQPKIEASQVYGRLMANSAPIENLDRVIQSLKSSGAEGQRAIAGMRAQAVFDLLDSAFSAGSRNVRGQRVFGATPFNKQFEKLKPKLELLFKDSPSDWAKLNNAYKISNDLVPPEGAIPRGSAGVILDIAKRTGLYSIMSKVPGADILLGMTDSFARKSKDEAAVRKAINAKPEVRALAAQIDRELPALASALGIAGISSSNTGEDNDQRNNNQ